MSLIAQYLGDQVQDDRLRSKFNSNLAQCPLDVKDELFEMIKDVNGIGLIIPQDRKDHATSIIERSKEQKNKIEEKMVNDLVGSEADGLSLRNIAILFMMLCAYAYLQRVGSLGVLVPMVNVLVLIVTIANLMRRIQ